MNEESVTESASLSAQANQASAKPKRPLPKRKAGDAPLSAGGINQFLAASFDIDAADFDIAEAVIVADELGVAYLLGGSPRELKGVVLSVKEYQKHCG